MKLKIILISILFFACNTSHFSQGFKITLKIHNLKETEVQLAQYFADKQYLIQTQKTDKNGVAIFQGNNKLPGGIYMIIIPKKSYFDFVIDDIQNFTIINDTTQLIDNIKFEGSAENSLFAGYNKFMYHLEKEHRKKMKDAKTKSDTAQVIAELSKRETDFWNQLSKKNPNSFTNHLLKMKYSFEKPDSLFLNEIEFSDAKLLRTPMFYLIVRRVIAKYIEKGPFVIIRENDLLIERAKANSEVYQFVVTYLLDFYATFYKTGINEVFVHLAEKYFLPNKAKWMNQEALNQIQKLTDKYKASFIGQIGKDIKLETSKGDSINIYSIQTKYKLLVFWSLGCGHCETANFFLRDYYKKLKEKGVEIISVNIDNKVDEWKKYVIDQKFEWYNCMDLKEKSDYRKLYYVVSSPLLIMLDNQNKILTKRYGEEQIKDLVNSIFQNEK